MTDKPMPDRSTCRHCGKSITWDDWSYTHDHSGFADCGVVTVSGGEQVTLRVVADRVGLKPTWSEIADNIEDVPVVLNPEITSDGRKTMAEPVEWNA